MRKRFGSLVAVLTTIHSFACAGEMPRIGVAAPLSEAGAVLGLQIVAGAREAARGTATIVPVDTACTREGGQAAAEAFRAAKADAVIGFLCTEAIDAALPPLTAAGIAVIDVGVRANRLTDDRARTGHLVWRVAPRSDAEANALAALVAREWRDTPFAVIDDGSIDGRGLADAVRTRLEADGVKPIALDTYRPAEEKQFGLVRRIARTGVTHLVVAGDRSDAAVIARDAAASGLSLSLIGGERFLDEPSDEAQLPAGTLIVAPRNEFPALPSRDAPASETREGYFGPAFAATQVVSAAVRDARTAGRPIRDVLNDQEFRTALGNIRFDANGDADLDLFTVMRFDGQDFRPAFGG